MDIDAFILIGGRSLRFGSPKAFAELGGKTLAERAAITVDKAISPKSLRFVAGSDDQFASELIFSLGHPVVADLKPGYGPWSGLYTALGYASCEWVFVLACDLPLVSDEMISKLASFTGGDVDAVVPRQLDGRLQPLCAFYRRVAVLSEIEGRLSGSVRLPPLTELFGSLNSHIVESEELGGSDEMKRMFLNINSVSDLPKKIAAI